MILKKGERAPERSFSETVYKKAQIEKFTKKEEKDKLFAELQDEMFKDPGWGKCWMDNPEKHVLQDPALNLWDKNAMESILKYYENHDIEWRCDEKDEAYQTIWKCGSKFCGNTTASQVACWNHVYFLRQPGGPGDLATKVLQHIDSRIEEAVEIVETDKCGRLDKGFAAFEINGKENYLNEFEHKRGKGSTSIDVVMVGKKKGGGNILFLIEWKYAEFYDPLKLKNPKTKDEIDKNKLSRYKIYNPLLGQENCPIKVDDIKDLYYDPYFQLMRQTLLGWKMAEAGEYGCDEYIHLHVIPKENTPLLESITAPGFKGKYKDMPESWKSQLKNPEKYRVVSPEDLLKKPLEHEKDVQPLLKYLETRYWK